VKTRPAVGRCRGSQEQRSDRVGDIKEKRGLVNEQVTGHLGKRQHPIIAQLNWSPVIDLEPI
jgi:hypothetical protein